MNCRVRSLVTSLLLVVPLSAGCGAPREVTYVDPNAGSNARLQHGLSSEPIQRHGTAAAERAKAVIRIRSSLAAARTLAGDDVAAASALASRAIEEDLPYIEPRVHTGNESLAASLRSSLERLRDSPPRNAFDYAREVRRISETLLSPAHDIAVPTAARQDAAFRSVLLYDTLQLAALSYEASFEGGDSQVSRPLEYRMGYGLLIDARTRQLEAVPEEPRMDIRLRLDRIARRSMPGPSPPADPRDPEAVLGEVATLAEDVVAASGVEPTYPGPDPATPDQLRSLQRGVASAVEAWERGAPGQALRQLDDARRTRLTAAADSVAAVSPDLLAQLERQLAIELPSAMAGDEDVATAAAEADARIDEAVQLVEEELELLRESG